jgi:hypothetical protein
MTKAAINFIDILRDLLDIPDEVPTLPLSDADLAALNQRLGMMFRAIPQDHMVWRVAATQQHQQERHREELRKRDERLATVGLEFFPARKGEILLLVADYPRLTEAYKEYEARTDSDSVEFGL